MIRELVAQDEARISLEEGGRYDDDGNFYNCYHDESGKLVWLPEAIEYAKRHGFTNITKG